jgi:hypothetical protein
MKRFTVGIVVLGMPTGNGVAFFDVSNKEPAPAAAAK